VASFAALDRLQFARLFREPRGLDFPGVGERFAQLPGLILDRKLGTSQRHGGARGRYAFLNEVDEKLYLFVGPTTS
jgi:hypothetical protein